MDDLEISLALESLKINVTEAADVLGFAIATPVEVLPY